MIDLDGSNKGKQPKNVALQMAEEADCDLVLINTNPPVFKILKFEKYLYEMKKKQKMNHKIKHSEVLKEIKFSPMISEHDISYKMDKAKELLDKGYKLKLSVGLIRSQRSLHLNENSKTIIENVYNKLIGNSSADNASGPVYRGADCFYCIITQDQYRKQSHGQEIRRDKGNHNCKNA